MAPIRERRFSLVLRLQERLGLEDSMTTRRGHTVLGLMLIVGGYALLFAALVQGRAGPPETNDHPSAAASGALANRCPCPGADALRAPLADASPGIEVRGARQDLPATDPVRATADPLALRHANSPAGNLDGGAASAGQGSDGGPRDPDASSLAPPRPGSVAQFAFLTGGAAMARVELERLQTIAKVLGQYPNCRFIVEGFPDTPGTDARRAGIAAHRARVGQAILIQGGVEPSRITLTMPGLDQAGSLAHTMRILIDPPVAEIEGL